MLFLAGCVFVVGGVPMVSGAPLNFVLVFSDEMPPEYLGAYGGKKYPTPALDALAADGVRFDNAFSVSPICTPARYSVQTGRYPGRCLGGQFRKDARGPTEPYFVNWNTRIEPHEPTLARALSAHGYRTGLAGKWHIARTHHDPGSLAARLPEIPEGALSDPAVQKALKERQTAVCRIVESTAGFDRAHHVIIGNWEEEPVNNDRHNIPWITKGAVELLREFAAEKKPFLLVTTPTGIHGPWHAAALDADLRDTPSGRQEDIPDYAPDYEQLREEAAGFSSGEKHKHVGMAEIDHHVATLRAELGRLGLADNTVLIFTADHGIEPGKATVYDRGLRVPLLISWPGKASGTFTDALAQHPDLTATIALAAGAVDAASTMDGVDLRPVLVNPAARVRDYAYFECGYSRGITDGRYKYIATRLPTEIIQKAGEGEYEWLTVGMGPGPGAHAAFAQLAYPAYYEADQFYDLEADPYELRNLWDDPAVAAAQVRFVHALRRETATFDDAFPAEAQPFFESETYRELTERTRRENNPHDRLDWVRRDHDAIPWPPADGSVALPLEPHRH